MNYNLIQLIFGTCGWKSCVRRMFFGLKRPKMLLVCKYCNPLEVPSAMFNLFSHVNSLLLAAHEYIYLYRMKVFIVILNDYKLPDKCVLSD